MGFKDIIKKIDEDCQITIEEYNQYKETQGLNSEKIDSIDGDALYEIIEHESKGNERLKKYLLKYYELE